MATPQLTSGSLTKMLEGLSVDKPVLQVLNLKKIQSDSSSQDRYRIQLSDGTKYQPCMLATQLNAKIHAKEVEKYCVVRLNRFVCNTIHNRKIIIVIDMTVLKDARSVGDIIGHPTLLQLVKVESNAPANQSPIINTKPGYQGEGATPNASSSTRSSYNNAVPPSRPGFDVGGFKMGGGGTLCHNQIFPISSLSPYQNRWTIRVRVSSKPSIRTWSNSRGEGRVFNVDIVDESGEIRASAFNAVADKMHSVFEMGKVYYISKGRLKPANKKFNSSNNDYELSLNEETQVELCTDDSSNALPTIQCNFKPIAEIESVEPESVIDVIGVCKDVSEIVPIVTKTTNRKVNKRDLYLVDRSGRVVNCTLWGAEAEEFDGSQFPIVAIKGAKVSDFGGRSLSTLMSSVLMLNPDIPEAHSLRGWFDSVGKNEESQSISAGQRGFGGSMETPFLLFSQVRDLDLGHGEKPDYFNAKATISFSRKENCLYKACPSQDCNKKVIEGSGGQEYFCEKCNQNFPNFKYRLILSINVADHSGSLWLTCFQETGVEILGVDSQRLGEMRDTDEVAYDQVFQKVNFNDFIFKIRAKMDTFNDEQRLKCYCVNASRVNYAKETRRRLENIKHLMAKNDQYQGTM